jgi:hypothetical protein
MPNVTITPPSTIKVQVGTPRSPQATTIGYGGLNQIKKATDVNLAGLIDGDILVYQQSSDTFIVEPVPAPPAIDGGTF